VTLRERVKDALGNILLVAASITICYAVAEFVFFRFMLPYMSLNILPHLPDRAAYFMQSSKSHFVPRDYIVLVGDSYAQGMGDWLYANSGDQSKPHHSANVLHDQLGTDVVSVGRAASRGGNGAAGDAGLRRLLLLSVPAHCRAQAHADLLLRRQ
jgi:hypothetical protein